MYRKFFTIFGIFYFRDVFLEKHWKSIIQRSVCDYFFEVQKVAESPEDIPPVIPTPHHYLLPVYRCSMFFIAVCMSEGKKIIISPIHPDFTYTFNDVIPNRIAQLVLACL